MLGRSVVHQTILVGLFSSTGFFSCDESLPPYNPPQNVLSAKLSVVEQASQRQVICPIPNTPFWDVPAIVFKISVTNQYSETLQGPAGSVTGQLEVWLKDDPDFGKKFSFMGATDPVHVKNGILTLNPGEALEVLMVWYHQDDQNRRIWKAVSTRPFYASIRARARIKVFKETPELFPEEVETQVFYDVDTTVQACDK
jgi:hypothetical protein